MKSARIKTLWVCRAAIIATVVIGAIAVLPATPSAAQQGNLPTNLVNVTLYQAPVTTALKALFNGTNLNYTVDPTVTGVVTCSLRSIPFDVALRSILRSAEPPLEFTVDDGVYNIHPKVQEVSINTGNVAQEAAPATAPTDTTEQSTAAQVFPLHLEYANAALILRYALSGTKGGTTGFIPSLDSPPTGGNNGGGGNSGGIGGGNRGGTSGGYGGGMSGGYGGGMSGGYGGGTTSGYGGGMTGGFTTGGY